MSERSVSPPVYFVTFAALILLTLATIGLSFVELGWWHIAVGLLIGAAKAILVVLFFMHLIRSGRTIWVVLGGGLFWLVVLFGLTLTDYWTRHWGAY